MLFPGTHVRAGGEQKREHPMPDNAQRIGWIGIGRMGYPMAEWLIAAGYDVSIFNRTRAKAEPLGDRGAKLVDRPADLAGVDATAMARCRASSLTARPLRSTNRLTFADGFASAAPTSLRRQ